MKISRLLPLALLASASPALAEVKAQSEAGFAVVHGADVKASTAELWKRLIAPKDWWNPEHSWSGSVSGFYIDASAGGCFCELFQEKDGGGKLQTKGSVEHMRVIFADPGKVLRMRGALGPLQSEAITGTLSVAITPDKTGAQSRISFSYVVGGFMRYKMADIAPAVDAMLGEQFSRLISPFERTEKAVPVPSQKAPAQEDVKPGGAAIDLGDIEQKAASEVSAEPANEAPGETTEPGA
jgi:hypothetical protein